MNKETTPDEIVNWYRSRMLLIPHCKQYPSNRYLTDDEVLRLFDGRVVIQEKVDGNIGWSVDNGNGNRIIRVFENMPIKRYSVIPANKRVHLDSIFVSDDECVPYIAYRRNALDYAEIRLVDPTIDEVQGILEVFAKMPSHFGAGEIEGIVVKNYTDGRNVLFGKWVCDKHWIKELK